MKFIKFVLKYKPKCLSSKNKVSTSGEKSDSHSNLSAISAERIKSLRRGEKRY